jgi:hypothetical protein
MTSVSDAVVEALSAVSGQRVERAEAVLSAIAEVVRSVGSTH